MSKNKNSQNFNFEIPQVPDSDDSIQKNENRFSNSDNKKSEENFKKKNKSFRKGIDSSSDNGPKEPVDKSAVENTEKSESTSNESVAQDVLDKDDNTAEHTEINAAADTDASYSSENTFTSDDSASDISEAMHDSEGSPDIADDTQEYDGTTHDDDAELTDGKAENGGGNSSDTPDGDETNAAAEGDDVAEIFDENSLDYDNTVYSDEMVLLVQYMPEYGSIIEAEYDPEVFAQVIAEQIGEAFPKTDESADTADKGEEPDGESVQPTEVVAPESPNETTNEIEEENPELEKKLKKRKRRKIIRRIVKVIILILCLLMIAAGVLLTYYYDVLNSLIFKELDKPSSSASVPEIIFDIPKTPTNPSSSASSSTSSDSSQAASSAAASEWTVEISDGTKLLNDPMILNVMLFGSDTRFADSAGNSDTMILLSLDNRHKKIKFTSFMRDTWINIPGYGPNKMNAAYSFDGPRLAIETIERNYGINIDRYAIVDFSSFIEIINLLGGIDIELDDFEIDYINRQMYDNRQTSDRHYMKVSAGVVHLNGLQALWHARNRDSYFSDFDRTSRQREVINAIMKKYENASLTTILDTVAKTGPKITTNLKKTEITTLVKNALTYLSYTREEFSMPDIYSDNMLIDNEFPTQYGPLSVLLIPDWNRARRDLASFIFEDSFAGYQKPQKNSSAAW